MSDKRSGGRAGYELSRFAHNVRIVLNRALNRLYIGERERSDTVDRFHKLYYDTGTLGKTWSETFWMGTRVAKCPFDLWTYQEILHDVRPDVIVECGTLYGGSAAYLASVCDLIGKGEIITIDVREREGRPVHPRITYLTGSSTDASVVQRVKARIQPGRSVLVILDSDHRRDHVLAELETYADLVTVGSYLIVEDTNLNGHPVAEEFGPGPMEALETFLERDARYAVDTSREKFYLTFNPRGYLKRQAD